MPYHIASAPGKFEVVDDAGKVVGTHPTRKQAVAQLQALYANVPEAKELFNASDMRAIGRQRAIDSLKAQGVELPTDDQIDRHIDALLSDKAASDPGDYLVVEDSEKPSTYHLQVRKNGKPDHTLMGAAWAALHEGYRGNKYEGPDKGKALEKLKKLYESEEMPLPGEKESKEARGLVDRFIDWVSGDKEGRRNATGDLGRLQEIHDLSVMNGAQCPMVFKQANGKYRWITISTNSYQDRDGEILSQESLEADVQRSDETGTYGPLRWWHMGDPDVEAKEAGPGIDIGACDFRALHGRMLIESGTFTNETIAAALKERAADLSVSVGLERNIKTFAYPLTIPSVSVII